MNERPTTKQLLGFDLDGVILDQIPNRILMARRLGIELTPREATSDLARSLVSEEEMDKIQEALYYDPVFALTAPLVPGIETVLESMSEAGNPYVLISRRRDPSLAVELMKKLGVWPHYFNPQNAFFVRGSGEKNRKARELGVSWYVDDQPSVLDVLVDVPMRMLFDPHDAHPESKFPRVSSWDGFLQNLPREVK